MEKKNWPKVGVIILNWNGKENTSECLTSIKNIDYQNYEIIVVDNASTDGSQELIKQQFPEIRLIENSENLGFGGGLNVGIREAVERKSEYVLCLNNDTIVDRNILSELVKIGKLNPNIGGLCPIEYNYDEPKRIICAGGRINFIKSKVFGNGEFDRGQFNEIQQTFLLSGPAMMLRLDCILDVGLFDESYFYGPEDRDIALRLMKKGFILVFVPKAKLWHKGRGATAGKITPLNIYFRVRNRLLFVKKNSNIVQMLLFSIYFWFFYFPQTLLKCFLTGKRTYFSAAVKGIIWQLNRNLLPSDKVMVKLLHKC